MKTNATNHTAASNRKLSLLGASGLLAIMVIQVPSLADLFQQLRSQFAQHATMLAGISEPLLLDSLKENIEKAKAEIDSYEKAMAHVDLMSAVQSELMEVARTSGCQIRKAVITAGSVETWEPEKVEEPELEDDAESIFAPEESPYSLATQQLSLSLTGTLDQVYSFLDRVREREWLSRVSQINFARDPEGNKQLIVEANLAFYKLTTTKATESDSVARRTSN